MDRRIGLDREQFGHRDARGRGDARQVVAQQIDDHQIFGALLGDRRRASRRARDPRRGVGAAPRGALHRLGGQLHAVEREEQFGRQRQQPVDPGRHHRAIPGARVRPQPRIDRQRIARDGHARAIAEIGLIDVARLDQRMDAVEAVGIGRRGRHRASACRPRPRRDRATGRARRRARSRRIARTARTTAAAYRPPAACRAPARTPPRLRTR